MDSALTKVPRGALENPEVPREWCQKLEKTFWAKIFISGPLDVIEHVCRRETLFEGLCVTVEPTKFIYTGGEETGAVVGLINYPRFPKNDDLILERATRLAYNLLVDTCQQSVLIMTPQETWWYSIRPEDNNPPAPEEDDPNSEYWRNEYVKACRETGTLHLDSGSARAMGNPLSFKERAELVKAMDGFLDEAMRETETENEEKENPLS